MGIMRLRPRVLRRRPKSKVSLSIPCGCGPLNSPIYSESSRPGVEADSNLKLDRLPEDPLTLAFLVAIATQVKAEEKQKLLELPGVPEMLALESKLLSRETQLLQFTLDTQPEIMRMNSGPTGYIFPN